MSSLLDDAVEPHSLDAERAVLGAILMDGRRWVDAGDVLRPEDFYRAAHQVLFAHMLTLGKRGDAIDPVTLMVALGEHLDAVGGLSYITKLTDGIPRSSNVASHCRIVARHAQAREMLRIGRGLITDAMAHGADLDAVQEAAEMALRAVRAAGEGDGFIAGPQAAERMLARLEEWQNAGDKLAGISTGFRSLDESTLGLHRTELVIIAGRPGMGKSAIAGQIAASVALDAGLPVGWFTLEMEVEEVTMRIAGARAGVSYRKLMKGYATAAELWRVNEQAAAINGSLLYFDDASDRNVAQIRRKCRLLHAKHPLGLVVVDYLTLLDGVPGERHDTRSREVGSWAKRFKGLAKELRVPVLLLCQLNRGDQQGANAKPSLKALRDSGELEQAANTVMFVHHDPEDGPERDAEVIVAKQRHGPVGPVHLRFNGPLVRFEEVA